MAKIEKTIIIHAPADKIFNFMTNPHNLLEIWPAMVEIKDVKKNPKGGMDFGWVYKMAGMRFEGYSETSDFTLNKHYMTHSKKGIESTFKWDYEPIPEGTRLHVEVEYKVPIPLVGKLAEAVITKQNDHEATVLLTNLKDRMEIEVPMPA